MWIPVLVTQRWQAGGGATGLLEGNGARAMSLTQWPQRGQGFQSSQEAKLCGHALVPMSESHGGGPFCTLRKIPRVPAVLSFLSSELT